MNEKIKLREIKCKKILTKTRLPEGDYTINPYVGCIHACVYCYARFIKRFTNHPEPWGHFIDIKTNAVEVLKKEIPKAKKGTVVFSSVTDCYNPLERKYKLTRNLLKILLEYQFPVSILTKSDLVLRDMDIFSKFNECNVGLTVTFLDDAHRKNFEPLGSSIESRLNALQKLHENKIETYGFIGPVFPYLVDISKLFSVLAKIPVDRIIIESLNTKPANWAGVVRVLKEKYPELLPKYKELFFTEKQKHYYKELKKEIDKLSRKYKIETEIYLH